MEVRDATSPANLTDGNLLVTMLRNHMVSIQHRDRDEVFRALADPTRREILGILRGGRQTVGGIARNFRMSRPAISKHIRQLHRAGLVTTRSEGTTTVCDLNAKPLRDVGTWLRDYEAFWSASLKSLKRYVEEGR